jgi:alkanesulfonate monooxygenase SsuD/methylene tetrahydromethanopterin reductase-like flavin-dependent oxidoreductase (luciferase family)
MAQQFQFGLDTFGDITLGPDGSLLTQAEVIRNVVEQGVHADALGVDAFGVGEHHRPDFAVSAPEVVLAAIAGRTQRIRLGSAVTVLSSDDPIRVFQRFSTLNAASNGRAEVTLGRGSFIESFPLFGYDLSQYEELFEEKLDLFAALLRSDTVTWQGRTRPPLTKQRIFPPIESIAVHSPGYVAATDEQAREEYWPAYKGMHDRIGAERGWPPIGRTEFDREVERGALHLGAPETVARKIAATAKALGIVRFDLKYSAGTLAHDKLMRCIELYGSKVIPLVRDMLA